MKISWRLASAALCSLIVLSCTSHTYNKMELGPDPMVDHVRQWTRTARLYRQFDTTVIVDVTFNSPRLRAFTVDWLSNVQRLTPEEKQKLLDEQMEESGRYLQFYLAMYTPEMEWSELAKKNPAWLVFVDTPKGPVFSEPAQKVRQEEIPWGASLPYDPRYRSFYKINIPADKIAQANIKLVLSSMLGEVYLDWDAR